MSILISSIKDDLLLEIFWNLGLQICMDALKSMYKIQNIIEKMHFKKLYCGIDDQWRYQALGYLWKFNALKSELMMTIMPMVKEYLVETLLNVLLDLYESFIQAIVGYTSNYF
jgi:hypothetical protein